jgi:hypothetical protein
MQLHQLLELVDEERSPAGVAELVPEILLMGRAPRCQNEGMCVGQALREIRKGACGTPNLRQSLPPMRTKHTPQKIGLTGGDFLH